ncbi:hypothetical protein FSP39_006183 [Pinctada imbricata]|uniref:Uncharacterized protein n=1 Tax=Pinctada imbricata TaxID=66713 RepID=A0AA88Y2L6_PINIB|nr:hypothetical protein FSP39_006183 [Pinctada imbricata]
MSENKLRKTLNKPPIPATGTKTHTPAVLTDSKGKWLLKTLAHKSESTAKWWYKSGDTCKDGYKWLKSNFKSKVKKLGDIWLYVWLGTCDLTTKKKQEIHRSYSRRRQSNRVRRRLPRKD